MFRRWLIGPGLLCLIVLIAPACNERNEQTSKAPSIQNSQMMRGQEIYLPKCATCHGTRLSGAPMFRDKEAWASRITQGMDHLVQSAIEGKGNMPAQGGKTGLGDEKIRAATIYMVENSK
jgi:cytochrome c5